MNAWSRLKLVTPAAGPVVTLPQAKKHCRAEYHTDDDTYLEGLVAAATATIEGPKGIGIVLSEQTWRLSLDCFPCEILIPLGPVISVESVSYTDADGNAATVEDWREDLDSEPCRIWPARDTAWPAVTHEPGAVKVEFKAGFATLPADLRAAILLTVGHLYEHREAVTADIQVAELPMGVRSILDRYHVGRVA